MQKGIRLVVTLILGGAIGAVPAFAFAAEQRTKGTAEAGEKPEGGSGKTPAGTVQRPGGGPAAAPLKGDIRLAPGYQAILGLATAMSFEKIKKKFDGLTGDAQVYELGVKLMPEIQNACANKSYSVQDQKRAGCTGNESLKQCMDKLYKHCVENWSLPGFSVGGAQHIPGLPQGGESPSHSTKQFREAAQKTATEARALSQMLNQYASQAEQNAKAFGHGGRR